MPIARNKKTGIVVSVPSHYIGHPSLGANLELITDEVKPATTPKKGNTTKEQVAPEAAPVSVQPETTK